jgi:GNAT superfamily N-acetyltransferase
MTVTVRDAVREDAGAIARVRVETWRAAYTGLMAQEILDRMDVERETQVRRDRWDELHADPRSAELIAEADGELAGWAAVGPSLDDDLPRDGQVYAIYTLHERWSQGVGHALLVAAEDRLRRAGYTRAHLWVLDRNARAAAFYERHGWTEDGATMTDERRIGGTSHVLFERRRARDLSEPPPPR